MMGKYRHCGHCVYTEYTKDGAICSMKFKAIYFPRLYALLCGWFKEGEE